MPYLEADNRKQDPILMKTVCFNLEAGYGKKLSQLIDERLENDDWMQESTVQVEGKRFIFGTIVRLSPKKKILLSTPMTSSGSLKVFLKYRWTSKC